MAQGGAQELGRLVRFLALGGAAAAVNWLSRPVWDQVMPFLAAVLCAYATGMVVAFVLFRAFVFPKAETPVATQAQRFVLVNIVGILLTFFLSWLLVEVLWPALDLRFRLTAFGASMDEVMFGHGLAIAAPTITSWFGHRYFTFRTAGGR